MATVTKRSPNSKTWSVYYNYVDEKGANKKKWESGFKTKSLANIRKAEIETEQAQHKFIVPSVMLVRELFEKVINVYGVKCWQPGTYELNEGLIRNHINTCIGDKPIQKVAPLDIEEMFITLRDKKVARGKGEDRPCLSSTTLRLIHMLLKQGFKLAVEWKLLNDNPVKMKPPQKSTTEATIWTPDVMFLALNEMREKHDQLYLAAHTAFVCAMRIGEAVGLQWECVDFSNDIITINKTLQRVNKNTMDALALEGKVYIFPNIVEDSKSLLILKQPKTKGSTRTVHMPPKLKHDLLMRKQLVAKQKAYHGKQYQDHDMVFCLENGSPIEPKLCEIWFKKFQKRSEGGYPKITFHEIRHSIATFLVILSGGNPAAVQKVTGHQSPELLLRVYNHATKEMVNELGQKFENVFYSQDILNADEVLYCKSISEDRISEMVARFDGTLDYPVTPQELCRQLPAPQSHNENIEESIANAVGKNPELREKILAMLLMQPAQIMQK